MQRRAVIFFSLLFLNASQLQAGGGWSNKKGTGFFKLSEYVIRSDDFYTPEGDIIPITTVSLYSSSIYGEYGVTDRLTAIMHFPFFVRSTINNVEFNQSGTFLPGDEVNSVGDALVGLKYGFFQDRKIVLATSLLFGLAFGEDEGGEGGILQTGDGEYNQMIRIDASHSFYPFPAYTTLTVGFNNRTRNFSDEIHYGFEFGYTVKKWLLTGRIYGVETLRNGDPEGSTGNGIFSNNTVYLSLFPGVSYHFNEKLGVQFEAGFAARGQRILASPSYELGIFFKL
jgi:hypothetical protein